MSVNLQAFKELVRVLEEVADDQFDLRGWVRGCGTIACAIGWAGSTPWFNNQGFCLARYEPVYLKGSAEGYRYSSGWDAVEEFFQITSEKAEYLFEAGAYPEDNRTRQAVIRRIMQFIKQEEAKCATATSS